MTDHLLFAARPSRLAVLLLCAPLVWGGVATAQTLRSSTQLSSLRSVLPTGPQTADFIVALVNSEPVTNNEVRQRMLRVEQQLTQQGAAMPARDELARQVLEQLVSERAQLQQATEMGLRVDEATLLHFQDLWSDEKSQNGAAELAALTPEEGRVYRALKENRWGQRLRLEQERIAWDYAWPALLRAIRIAGERRAHCGPAHIA